jgi:hypothetical protein
MAPAMINQEGITFSESAAPQLMLQMQRSAKFCEAARSGRKASPSATPLSG